MRKVRWAALVGVLLVAPAAGARPGEMSFSQEVEKATENFAKSSRERANKAYDERRYGDALSYFQLSYAASGDPKLLFNIGRTLMYLDRWPEAVTNLERFEKSASPELRAAAKVDAVLRDARSRVASIDLTVNIPGAVIILNDHIWGTAPIDGPIKVNAGAMKVEVVADNYAGYRRQLRLTGGGTATLDVTLFLISRAAHLAVNSKISGSELYIDGKSVGSPPLDLQVEAGSHRLRIEHPGYKTYETTTVLVVGDKKEISIDPIDTTPIYGKWWFWASVAGVAVISGVAIYALTTERSPDSGGLGTGVAPLLKF